MKKWRLVPLAAALLLLTGCSFLNRSYSNVSPHSAAYYESEDRSVLRAESYQDLVNDLLVIVQANGESGTIWLYTGPESLDAESAVSRACQEVQRETPMGAYAVDYMTYTVNEDAGTYSEIVLEIRYRRTPAQIAAIVHTTSVAALYDLLSAAADAGADALVMQVDYYHGQEQEVRDIVAQVHQERQLPEETTWQVYFYPNPQQAGIIEIIMDE